MIEIKSPKIDKEELQKQLQNTLNKVDFNQKEFQKFKKFKLQPSTKPDVSIIYKILVKIAKLLSFLGLHTLVSIGKAMFRKVNFQKSSAYLISDFTKYNDEEFIKNTYETLTGKTLKEEILFHYLHLLRSGTLSKSEIVIKIRYSQEGIKQNINILGRKKRYLVFSLYSLPLIGYGIKVLTNLILLPKLIRRINADEANNYLKNETITKNFHEVHTLMATKSDITLIKNELDQEIQNIQNEHRQEIQNIQNEHRQEIQNIQNQLLEQLQQLRSTKAYLRTTEQNIKMLITEAKSKLDSETEHLPSSTLVNNILNQENHLLDELYLSFEDKFRGSRETIKERLRYYIPIIQNTLKRDTDTLIDMGCGRGEWLELLRENNITAKGIDLNTMMVAECLKQNLDVHNSDAIAYLKTLESNSVAAVTGFHIVEHLPFEVLIELFDEALRVLRPEGIIIFETPNPENLFVGSCSFYTDPTHKNPIPPVTLEFLAQNRGFSDLQIHRLHPLKEPQLLQGEDKNDVNNLIFASTKEQDYSIIGYKNA